jgi:MSHA biogenesis protein MshM
MYLNHFGLSQPPFSISSNPEFYVESANSEEAVSALLAALHGGEAFIKVVGEVGTGKTMLCRKVLDSLGPTFVTAVLSDPTLGPLDLHRAVAGELGVSTDLKLDRFRLLKYITEELVNIYRSGKSAVLIIDEAQALPTASLECVRLLTNLEFDNRKLLQVVLLGQPELDLRLSKASLCQRITLSHRLDPISLPGIREYVTRRLAVAGSHEELFSSGALRIIHRRSRGIPRLINALCHKSLMSACGRGDRMIESLHLRRAIAHTEDARRWRGIRKNARPGVIAFAAVLVIGSGLGFYNQLGSGGSGSAPNSQMPVSAHPSQFPLVLAPDLEIQTRWLSEAIPALPSADKSPASTTVESERSPGGNESVVSSERPAALRRLDNVKTQAEDAYRKAVSFYQQGRLEESAGEFEISLSLVTEHHGARESLALILIQLGAIEAAISVLNEGLEIDPAHLPFAMLRARLSVELGAIDEAVGILEAVSLDDFDVDHAAFLAALLQRRNEHDRSIALYSQVLNSNPDRAIWWMGLGISLEAKRRSEDALKIYRTARAVGTLTGEPRAFVSRRIRTLEDEFL